MFFALALRGRLSSALVDVSLFARHSTQIVPPRDTATQANKEGSDDARD